MSSIKRSLLLFSLILALASCDKTEEVLLTTELLTNLEAQDYQISYKTETVKRGDFTNNGFCMAKPFFINKHVVTYSIEGANITFNGYLVESGSFVKKGEPIASISVKYDTDVLEDKELQLSNDKINYEFNLKTKYKTLHDAERKLSKMKEGTEKLLQTLRVKKIRLDYENYKMMMNEALEGRKNNLDQFKKSVSKTHILAPIDGFINNGKLSPEDSLQQDTPISVINTNKRYLIEAIDTINALRYGTIVTIRIDKLKESYSFQGKVISSPNILTNGLSSNIAYIEILDDTKNLDINDSAIMIEYESFRMNNVLLINPNAICINQEKIFDTYYNAYINVGEPKYYVSILNNGKVERQYVTIGGSNNQHCWILSGLEEGQTVILNK